VRHFADAGETRAKKLPSNALASSALRLRNFLALLDPRNSWVEARKTRSRQNWRAVRRPNHFSVGRPRRQLYAFDHRRGIPHVAYQRGVTLDFSRPGKPTDNAFIEAFNGRFRVECLNAQWLLSLADAREKMEDWRKYYNEERPHGSIGQNRRSCCSITPAQPARRRDKAGKL
jgi:transposase InsO family protein